MSNYNPLYNGTRDRLHNQNLQVELDLHKIEQLQDQDNRNFTLGGILSCLETIAFLFDNNIKKKYNGYNPTSIQDKKTLEQLIIQLRIQSKAFQNMYEECIDKSGEYQFPSNLPKTEIIEDIKQWKKVVEANYKEYYDNIIYLFEGQEEKIHYPPINHKRQNPVCNPEKQIKLIPPNIAYINLRRKLVKDDYMNGRTFDNNLQLYKEKHYDPRFEEMIETYKKGLENNNFNNDPNYYY
jgi:hypothetical protein